MRFPSLLLLLAANSLGAQEAKPQAQPDKPQPQQVQTEKPKKDPRTGISDDLILKNVRPAQQAEEPLEAQFKDTGLDKRPYSAPEPPDPSRPRRPWNIRPVNFYGRLDNMRFGSQSVDTPSGPLSATLGTNVGLGFGASIEALPFRWGAVVLTWDYRYGFANASSLSISGPDLYKHGKVDVVASHQVGVGAMAGFRTPFFAEWGIGLEQRLEAYRVTGPSGSPSTATLGRTWARAQARWNLDVIRDFRPFIGLDIAVPLRRAKVGAGDYVQDLTNLLGVYPVGNPGNPGATTVRAGDALAKGHAGEFQIGLTYGFRLFRPRMKFRGGKAGVEIVPTKPVAPKEYEVPAEALGVDQQPEKKAPKETPKPQEPGKDKKN